MAFDDWYGSSRGRVLAALIVACGDVHVAAEATDEACLRALERWDRVGVMGSPTGWAVMVGLNVVRRRQRRIALERRLLRREHWAVEIAGPAGEAWLAVRDLPQRQRQVLVLRYVADLPEAAIADLLGVSRSAVSSALTDGRRSLASAFTDDSEVVHAEHP